ncbi:uncharacterized protein LOC128996626 [Macrosteles quadrilineatus]|uniref:uncharacterized protein LOC128996626 n=1 Tax=Macrosteles quadrilineatus TaxID=74068 RepID=UPI0023E340AD|nr:uncharacterized protein LOC128996626 [Macrosteles quadrilineatus]XP_054278006.1 uncharacterized protein LOC128996626 [Macrosteles quadrilineatus]
MTAGLFNGQALSPPSKTVNVFDLTSKQGITGGAEVSSKERAARITLYVILTLVVLTAVSLLLGEALGLQWTLCVRGANKTAPSETLYQWPWSWKNNGQTLMSESYKERWDTLSLQEKRRELFRASMGEIDLYDMYDIPKHPQHLEVN